MKIPIVGRFAPRISEVAKSKPIVIYGVVFAVIGLVLLATTSAAGPFVSLEPEDVAVSNPATVATDGSASGGEYVLFNDPSGGGPFDPRTYDWEANTGPSGPLTKINGDVELNNDGEVLENVEVHGRVTVTANNAIIRNSHIYSGEWYSVLVDWDAGGSLTIEDTEIGHSDYPANAGMAGSNITARNLDIHHHEDGLKAGSGSTYEYMYIHDMEGFDPAPHADAIQEEGAGNWRLSKCWLDPTRTRDNDPGNASIIAKPDLGAVDNIVMEDCVFQAGNYTLDLSLSEVSQCASGITMRNNYILPTWRYGPLNNGGCNSNGNYDEWSNNYVQRWNGSAWENDYILNR